MTSTSKDTGKLRKVTSLLAGENCGKCGFENCGEFAVALVEGQASPLDCKKSLDNLGEICQVLGVAIPKREALPTEERRHQHNYENSYDQRRIHRHEYHKHYRHGRHHT